MKELIKRVIKSKTGEPEVNETYFVVQFDYRYPQELFGVVALNYYGSTAKVVDQYLRMGWAFRTRVEAEKLAKELNQETRKKVKQWS